MTRTGRCYELSAKLLADWRIYGVPEGRTDVYLIHGTVEAEGVRRHGHAWVEWNQEIEWPGGLFFTVTMAYDPVAETALPAGAYHKFGRVIEVARYNIDEAAVQMVKTGHYGPWKEER